MTPLESSYCDPSLWREALQLTEARAADLNRVLTQSEGLVFAGMGSGLHLARTVAPLFQLAAGRTMLAVPYAHLLLSPAAYLPRVGRWGLVAVSWPGEDSEALEAIDLFRQWCRGGILGLTCDPDSPITGEVDKALVLPAGEGSAEAGLAGHFTTGLIALQVLAASVSQDVLYRADLRGLSSQAEQFMPGAGPFGSRLASLHPGRVVCVGTGPLQGVAEDGARMIRAATGLPCEAYATGEFLAGPAATLGPAALVIVLRSIAGGHLEDQAEVSARSSGASVVSLGGGSTSGAFSLAIGATSADRTRPALYHLALRVAAQALAPAEPVPANTDEGANAAWLR